ncbi:MAG: MetQ/NlpA family ABC transporter substrate-binding protein [Jeotgalicoccus sp.]|jgi:D-methionine transport system substrate-binding protein|nr:MetQ/NlpA family ABC transporter substrate-binding protein [Jeotgalicoccus sp.]
MKKLFPLFLILTIFLAACGNDEESAASEEDTHIVIASQSEPLTTMVETAAEVIEEPYTMELLPVNDNIQYNEATFNDEVDGSLAQHELYMEGFNEEAGADLVAIQPAYISNVGFYSPVYDSIDEIETGAEVAIPSDPPNEARALLILDSAGIITLDENTGIDAAVADIVENPKNLEFTHVDLFNLTAAYEDGVELVFEHPNFIANIGLYPKDAILLEDEDEKRFAFQLVTREGKADSEKMQAAKRALTSREVYDVLMETAEHDMFTPAFEPGQPAE